MSKAKMWTLMVISSSLTSLRLRFVISWNGNSFLVALSQATASQSSTNESAPSLIALRSDEKQGSQQPNRRALDKRCGRTRGSCSTKSGYLALMFSELRE